MKSLAIRPFHLAVVWGGVLLLSVLAIGCGTQRANQQREESNLKPLAVFYGRFTGQKRGRPPANEAEFKEFVRSRSSGELASFNVSDPESVFISSRDRQPYVVIYGEVKGPSGPGGSPVIAYEQTGKGGKRYVASSLGAIEEVDEARFKELVPNGP